MKQVDEGATSPKKLIFYLEEYFGYPYFNDQNTGLSNTIAHLENYKGNWRIYFNGLPSDGLLLSILALFETKMAYDGIETIIFNYAGPNPQEIENVAGCLKQEGGIARVMQLHNSLKNRFKDLVL